MKAKVLTFIARRLHFYVDPLFVKIRDVRKHNWPVEEKRFLIFKHEVAARLMTGLIKCGRREIALLTHYHEKETNF